MFSRTMRNPLTRLSATTPQKAMEGASSDKVNAVVATREAYTAKYGFQPIVYAAGRSADVLHVRLSGLNHTKVVALKHDDTFADHVGVWSLGCIQEVVKRRMGNSVEQELRVAAEQTQMITRLRLEVFTNSQPY